MSPWGTPDTEHASKIFLHGQPFLAIFLGKNYCFIERFECQISDFKRRSEQLFNKLTWIWHRNIKKVRYLSQCKYLSSSRCVKKAQPMRFIWLNQCRISWKKMCFGQQTFNMPNQKAHKYLQVDLQRVYNIHHITYQCNIEFKPIAVWLKIEFKPTAMRLQMNSTHG